MRTWRITTLLALVGAVGIPAAAAAADRTEPVRPEGAEIAADYIVILEADADTTVAEMVTAARDAERTTTSGHGSFHVLRVTHEFHHAVRGFSASMSPATAEALQANPDVAIVERDQIVSIDATWGQDRIDERELPLDGRFAAAGDGTGVHAYVIDTGIRTGHRDFGGRVGNGFSAIGGGVGDCNGHGTHVAGTIGGSTYGVAPDVTLHAVRVLDCNGSGSNSGVIAGVDWVAANAVRPAVANMSLGGGPSAALDRAVANATNQGITMVVAAGNSTADACNSSPSRAPSAITVGASTRTDARAGFSNFGRCLDIFAPGQDIVSTWYTSDTATRSLNGTSMAAPHVAGGAAIELESNPSASPAAVTSALIDDATTGALSGIGSGSPNRLLYVGDTGGPTPPPPPPPPAGCDASAERFSGSLNGTGSSAVEPDGTYYRASAGRHVGCLVGPDGTDFDLELYRWSGFGWRRVARAVSPDSTETLTYDGRSGYYVWVVRSASGSGGYEFGLDRP